jgi:hypothetical protein
MKEYVTFNKCNMMLMAQTEKLDRDCLAIFSVKVYNFCLTINNLLFLPTIFLVSDKLAINYIDKNVCARAFG